MRLLQVAITGVAAARVNCPPGHEIRIASIVASVQNATVAGDAFCWRVAENNNATVLFYSSVIRSIVVTDYDASWAVGQAVSGEDLQTGHVVATGVNTWSAPTLRTGGLPDLWLDSDVAVQGFAQGAANTSSYRVFYDIRKLDSRAKD